MKTIHNEQINETALNLCDIFGRIDDVEALLKLINSKSTIHNITRLYIGSYYCDHYYLYNLKKSNEKMIDYAKSNGLKITLVIPPLFEANLGKGIDRTRQLIAQNSSTIDEITINDWGMALCDFCESSIKINMGRILQKDNRDPRYPNHFNVPHTHRCFTDFYNHLLSDNNITGVELDCTNKAIIIPDNLSDIQISVHYPWAYISMSSICVFASATKAVNNKFRFANSCSCECNNAIIRMNCGPDFTLYRIGRSVQFLNDDCKIISSVPFRCVYSPFDEIINKTI